MSLKLLIKLKEIKETLQRPDKISSSVYDENKSNYYRFYKSKKEYLKVIVSYLNGKGFYCNLIFCEQYCKMKGKMTLNYDQESDYLEIFIEGSSPTYGQEVGEDIMVFRNKDTDEVVGVGILNFKKRTKSFNNLKLDLPLNVNFSDLIV